MKEIVIVSGKGGTGKTSITAALAHIAENKIIADCDVDAANLHLVVGNKIISKHEFTSGFEPVFDPAKCTKCGFCSTLCRFDAIRDGIINEFACEGCGVCAFNCPSDAIQMQKKPAGHWLVSQTKYGLLVHANLGLAIENSGKLVSEVRNQAKLIAKEKFADFIITDGPPGIGCPAIAAISGAQLILAVVEPTISGIHDLKRLVKLTQHFNISAAVCINKSTLHAKNTEQIRNWCAQQNITIVGEIPYHQSFRTALQNNATVMELNGDEDLKLSLKNLWENIYTMLG